MENENPSGTPEKAPQPLASTITPPATSKAPTAPFTFDLDAVAADTKQLITTVAYKHGISFQVRYIPRSEFQRIQRESTTHQYDESLKARVPQLDAKKLVPLFCSIAVAGWEGVTPRSLSKIVPVDLSKIPEEAKDAPIPFSQEQLIKIVARAYELDLYLNNAAQDLTLYSTDLPAQLKN